MTRYLIEEQALAQPWAAVMENPENRTEPIRKVFEAVGGRLEAFYVAVGGSTAYLIAEVPDSVSMAAISTAIMAGGALSSIKSTAILTAEEMVEAFKKAKSVAYRPPGE